MTAIDGSPGGTSPRAASCGGTSRDVWPNNMVGYGRIDVFAAYRAAVSGMVDLSDDR
ncbi:MAG TPA: hypothetical protein VGQ93_14045 [Lysobacter sp.]|nr:hypothetical protein [Lysobacter sp.]